MLLLTKLKQIRLMVESSQHLFRRAFNIWPVASTSASSDFTVLYKLFYLLTYDEALLTVLLLVAELFVCLFVYWQQYT